MISDISSMPCLPNSIKVVYNPRCTDPHITGTVCIVYFRYFKRVMFTKLNQCYFQPTVHNTHITGTVCNVYFRYFKRAMYASPVKVVYIPPCTDTHITGTVRNVYFRYFKHAMFAKPSQSYLQPTAHRYTHYWDCTQCIFQIFQACHVCQTQSKLFSTHGAQIHTLLGLYAMSMNCMEAAEAQFQTAVKVK